jgi:hypothetical protein
MTRDEFVARSVRRWVTEHQSWLSVHGVRVTGTVLDVGRWLEIEEDLVAEALRLYAASRTPRVVAPEQTTFALEDIAA